MIQSSKIVKTVFLTRKEKHDCHYSHDKFVNLHSQYPSMRTQRMLSEFIVPKLSTVAGCWAIVACYPLPLIQT